MASGLVAQLSPLLVSPRAGRGARGMRLVLDFEHDSERIAWKKPSRIDRSSRAFRYFGAEFRLPHARSIAGGSFS